MSYDLPTPIYLRAKACEYQAASAQFYAMGAHQESLANEERAVMLNRAADELLRLTARVAELEGGDALAEMLRLREEVRQSIDVRCEGRVDGLNDYEAEFYEAAETYCDRLQAAAQGDN